MFGLLRTLSSTHLHTSPPAAPGPLHPCLWGGPSCSNGTTDSLGPSVSVSFGFHTFAPLISALGRPHTHAVPRSLQEDVCCGWGEQSEGKLRQVSATAALCPAQGTQAGGGGVLPPLPGCAGAHGPPQLFISLGTFLLLQGYVTHRGIGAPWGVYFPPYLCPVMSSTVI